MNLLVYVYTVGFELYVCVHNVHTFVALACSCCILVVLQVKYGILTQATLLEHLKIFIKNACLRKFYMANAGLWSVCKC